MSEPAPRLYPPRTPELIEIEEAIGEIVGLFKAGHVPWEWAVRAAQAKGVTLIDESGGKSEWEQ